jgi:hypothetical protein
MEPFLIALLVRPAVNLVLLALVVAPIVWVLYRIFPEGRVKVALFKVRKGPTATRRDDLVMAGGVMLAYVVLGAVVWAYS